MQPPAEELSTFDTPQLVIDHLRRVLEVATVAITLPTDDAHTNLFVAGRAFPEPYSKQMPPTYSICRHVAKMRFALVVDDTFSHPLLKNHPATRELGVAAYLGVPVTEAAEADSLIVLCALHNHQRRWSESDIALLESGAERLRSMTDLLHSTPA